MLSTYQHSLLSQPGFDGVGQSCRLFSVFRQGAGSSRSKIYMKISPEGFDFKADNQLIFYCIFELTADIPITITYAVIQIPIERLSISAIIPITA